MTNSILRKLLSNNHRSTVVQSELLKDYGRSNNFLMKILFAHWIMASTVMGYAHGFYLMGFIGGAVICSIAFIGFKFLPNTTYSRILMGVSLMLFSALYIQQHLGRIEIHFHIFAALAWLIRYKDLKPLLAAVVTVALHHLVFNYCQQFEVNILGTPLMIFDYGTGLDIVILHAAFVIFEAAFLSYIITQLTDQYSSAVDKSNNTLVALNALDYVIKTKDASERLDAGNEHAYIVNTLLQWMNENIAVQEAMNQATACLMIVDREGLIIEYNQAAENLFTHAQTDYQTEGVNYSPSSLQHRPVTELLKGRMNVTELASLQAQKNIDFEISSISLHTVLNPIINETGERLGAVIEWTDRTQAVRIENEIQDIVTAASSGDLSCRINTENKEGFYQHMASGMNQLLFEVQKIIKDSSDVLSALSSGNLNQRIEAQYSGDFGKLKENVNGMIDKLTGIVDTIKRTSSTVSDGARDIAGGNQNLSIRTEQQSTSLQDTSASMVEMTATVKSNASYASEAESLVIDARNQAEQGGEVVSKAVLAMSEISKSSEKIADIIGVIDSIAFQTNLLALNAAVESARAGEQGQGFAVVASEVRNLAGRSAVAANEIKGFIEDSVGKVEEGAKLVDESGNTLRGIVASVNEASRVVGEIAAANHEQSSGIDIVNIAISQIDEMTRQNAALVEEAAVASEAMGAQASELNEQISFFSTAGEKITTNNLRQAS